MNDNAIEIIKTVSQVEGEEQSLMVSEVAKNRDVLASGLSTKLVKLASEFKLINSVQTIKNIASNKILEKHKRSVYFLIRMLSANTDEEITKLYN